MLKRTLLIGLVLGIFFVQIDASLLWAQEVKKVSIPIPKFNESLYIPHTKKQADAFWKIAEQHLPTQNDKEGSGEIMDVYFYYLIYNMKTTEELSKFLLFEKCSGDRGIYRFPDFWVEIIKTKPGLFKAFYLTLNDKSKSCFGGRFMDFFWKMPQSEKDKWIKYLGLKKHVWNDTEDYW